MPKLNVVITSTRPGRVGPAIGQWFAAAAKLHGGFEVELVDLAEFDLPLLDEPHHPRAQKYEHDHTKRWSESVAAADAFVFILPEYNFNPPATLVNALDYLYNEWNYKPAGLVSYGGVSGGLRSAQATKGLLTTLKMMPIVEAVVIPFFSQHMAEGAFVPNEMHEQSATELLNELLRWTNALMTLR